MKILILFLTLLLPCWAAAEDIPQVCREAEALSGMPDVNTEKELGLYEQCLKNELPPLVRASVLYNMAVTYQDMGQWGESLEHYEAALRIHPDDYQTLNNMALILATSNDPAILDGERALELSRKAGKLAPSLATLDTYATALARVGRYEEAASLEQKLLREAHEIEGFPAELLKEMENRSALYASGSPYTEPAPSRGD